MDEPIKKNISVKPFIHERLVNMKHGHDTFDDVIERLLDACEGKPCKCKEDK